MNLCICRAAYLLAISLITDDSIELKLLATLSVWPILTVQAEGQLLTVIYISAVPETSPRATQPQSRSQLNTAFSNMALCLHWPAQPREQILLRYTRKTSDAAVTPDREIVLLTPNLHFGLRSLSCAQPSQVNQGTNLQAPDLD